MLDSDYIHRAAPPGSMRYFALLFTPTAQRELLSALLVIDAEIRVSATQVSHDVAHTRLRWWRGEIDRLVNRNAQHPATKLLQATSADFSRLHELLVAADMDLTRMTYHTNKELNAYLRRSGGTIWDLFAQATATDAANVAELGTLIRRIETLRDLAIDARAGRIYWPLDELQEKGVEADELRDPSSAGARRLLMDEIQKLLDESKNTLSSVRPLNVLAQLHLQLLNRIAIANYDVVTERHEIAPFRKLWTAWRAARLV